MQNTNEKTALGLDANIGAMLCYVGNLVCFLGLIYSIIVIVQDKTNKLARFHAFQSILLTVIAIVLTVINVIVQVVGTAMAIAMDSTIISLFFTLIALVLGLSGLVLFVFLILAAVKAFQGEVYKIPLIGNLADKYSN